MQTENLNHETKHLREIGFNMNLLLVEDDELLQNQIKQLLLRFFGRVDVADNGLEALAKYSERPYDLIITDITMPLMNGIEFARKVKNFNSLQNILILSAHSESEKLLELINIGIEGFILKPVNIESILTRLDKVCQAIYDHKMLTYYSDMLEATNKELRESNAELDRALNELTQIKSKDFEVSEKDTVDLEPTVTLNTTSALRESDKVTSYNRQNKMSADEFFEVYPFELDKTNEDLEYLEDNFNLLILKFENNTIEDTFHDFILILKNYAKSLAFIPQFGVLSDGIEQLARAFEQVNDPKKFELLMPKITLMFDNLEQWRRGIFFYRNVEDIHYMDNSLISDALSIQEILCNAFESSEDSMMKVH